MIRTSTGEYACNRAARFRRALAHTFVGCNRDGSVSIACTEHCLVARLDLHMCA